MSEENWSFKINIPELRKITNILLDHIQEMGGDSVDLPVDYYWHIPDEQIYNPNEDTDPSSFTIGQLTDDWQKLRKFLDREEYGPIGYGLVWLSAVLRAIGEHNVG